MILSRASWSANRNAMVIRRIENEHGCTLSSSEEAKTSGKSHAPPPLAPHIKVAVAGLNLRMRIPIMNAPTAVAMIRMRFILRGDDRLNFKLECVAALVGKYGEAVDPPNSGGAVRVGVVDNADGAAFARLDQFISRRHIPHARHAEGPFGAAVRLDNECGRAHARGDQCGHHDVFASWVGYGEVVAHVAVLHRDSAEVVERLRRDKWASGI